MKLSDIVILISIVSLILLGIVFFETPVKSETMPINFVNVVNYNAVNSVDISHIMNLSTPLEKINPTEEFNTIIAVERSV